MAKIISAKQAAKKLASHPRELPGVNDGLDLQAVLQSMPDRKRMPHSGQVPELDDIRTGRYHQSRCAHA
jgi:hypothetical protein